MIVVDVKDGRVVLTTTVGEYETCERLTTIAARDLIDELIMAVARAEHPT